MTASIAAGVESGQPVPVATAAMGMAHRTAAAVAIALGAGQADTSPIGQVAR